MAFWKSINLNLLIEPIIIYRALCLFSWISEKWWMHHSCLVMANIGLFQSQAQTTISSFMVNNKTHWGRKHSKCKLVTYPPVPPPSPPPHHTQHTLTHCSVYQKNIPSIITCGAKWWKINFGWFRPLKQKANTLINPLFINYLST